jgi:hypothetical protein
MHARPAGCLCARGSLLCKGVKLVVEVRVRGKGKQTFVRAQGV